MRTVAATLFASAGQVTAVPAAFAQVAPQNGLGTSRAVCAAPPGSGDAFVRGRELARINGRPRRTGVGPHKPVGARVAPAGRRKT
jgi:hypothetical protein